MSTLHNRTDIHRPRPAAALLDELRAAFTRYVAFPCPEAADAVTLWTAATHAQPAWDCAPRLAITSPVKQCGKSRLLDVIEATSHDPLLTVNISAAALARSISDDDPPALLLDEADSIFGRGLKGDERAETLRGLINAGHSRNRPYIRWNAAARIAERCPSFAMAAIAGIGDLPDTIMDRSVVIRMRRRGGGEPVAKLRQRHGVPALRELGGRVTVWARAHIDDLAGAEPYMPPGLADRAEDTWEPLLCVADLAGGDWPGRARRAAVALTVDDETDTTLGARLLADLREVFGDAAALHGETVLAALHKIGEAPWADYFGRQLNQRDLARLLRPYGIRPCLVKVAGVALRGYRRDDLHDAWSHYLPPAGEGSVTTVTSVTPQVKDHDQVTGNTRDRYPVTPDPALTSAVTEVTEVTDLDRALHTPADDARWANVPDEWAGMAMSGAKD